MAVMDLRFLLGVVLLLWIPGCRAQSEDGGYVYPYQTIENCRTGDEDSVHQYYDSVALACVDCAQNVTFQTVTADGLSCRCQERYRKQGGPVRPWAWTCVECPEDQVASEDGWECVACETGTPVDETACPDCVDAITVERLLNGSSVTIGNDTARACATCSSDTAPDEQGRRCERCNGLLSYNATGECSSCPGVVEGGVCFRESSDVLQFVRTEVSFSGDLQVDSALLVNHLKAAHGMCTNQTLNQPTIRDTSEYSNLTACQLLGNLCAMILYGSGVSSNALPDACALHRGLADIGDTSISGFPAHLPGVQDIQEWVSAMPWLYYADNTNEQVTKDTNIPTIYAKDSRLELVGVKYHANGTYLGFLDMTGEELQLCPDVPNVLDAALIFGNKYKKTCEISVDALFDDKEYATYFYDLFLQYSDANRMMLNGVPILVTNYRNPSNQAVNTGSDPTEWQLVHRYMKVDREIGKAAGVADARPAAVRYASTMTLTVTLQDEGDKEGKIYPPRLDITYADVPASSYGTNATVQVTFEVDYKMSLSSTSFDISLAVGLLSVVALIYSLFLTHTRSRRSGEIGFSILTLMELFFFLCGTLADVFFAVMLGFSIWWFAVYKGQAVFYMVPDSGIDSTVQGFLGAAFALKALHLLRIIGNQVMTDIFFVDWEIAPAPPKQPGRRNPQAPGGTEDGGAVSAWRTYLVANEWNEIQTVRRINPVAHGLLVILLLHVVGLEQWARYDTSMDITYDPETRSSEYSVTFRFAVLAIVYILVAMVQWVWYLLVGSWYRPNPVDEFEDLCSSCNISVVLMTHNNFGYYIHGRSVHGQADVSLARMYDNMAREEMDLCGRRGLEPCTDTQTFDVVIPRKLRSDYNKVLLSATLPQSGAAAAGARRNRSEEQFQKRIQAYNILNKFLKNFIDHNLSGIQYLIRDKSFLERLLDTEFIIDDSDTGYFLSDRSHTFDKAIFYGHEATLQLFEILFFTVMDFIFQNFVLAAILSYAMDAVIVVTRRALGKRNISNKTMVDERFLI